MSLKNSRQKFLDAIDQCQLRKIISLVKNGHNIHIQNEFRQNLLIYILQQQQKQREDDLILKKRFQIFQFLITHYNLNIYSFDSYGKNLFNWATNLNCSQEALYLLKSYPGDIDILVRDHTGSCSLHYAIEHGNDTVVHAIVNYLLRYRLRFDIKDGYNNTPEELARKLGYEKISNFLGEACRLTNFLSREIPSQKQKSLLDSSEYFNSSETRINIAKSLDDWKSVAALRTFKKIPTKTPDSKPQSISQTSRNSSISKLPTISQPEQMLRLIEPQITSSFRRSFIPIDRRSINPIIPFQRMSTIQRKLSQTSSHRLSSVLSQRHRDSGSSQTSITLMPDIQNRVAIPPVFKQYRQSILTTN